MSRKEDIKLIQKELKLKLKNAQNLTNSLGNLEKTDVDDDGSNASEQIEITTQLASFESKQLVEIEYAMQKMKDGTYGICEECEKEIVITRLQALPTTTHCIKCKSQIEKNLPSQP